MKTFLHSYPNLIIGVLAIVFLCVIVAFSVWTVDDVFIDVHNALTPPPPQSAAGFNLAGAAKLGLGSH
jgi:hypothetical protein